MRVQVQLVKRLAVSLAILLLPVMSGAATFSEFQDIPWEKLSDREISDWGTLALGIEKDKWRHGETAHFVIHFFRDGDKISRRSEAFYEAIHDFFGKPKDRMEGHKSHVFAFRDADDWVRFIREIPLQNILGITRRDEFFYLSTGNDGRFDSKAKVQAHEMTHLIFNRFFEGTPPLWLNEGIAEFFGQRETASTIEFRRIMGQAPPFDLNQLFSANGYPGNPAAIQGFYSEAAIVVDFLSKSADRRELLPRFVEAMIKNGDLAAALKIYGYSDLAEFEKAYQRYRRRF